MGEAYKEPRLHADRPLRPALVPSRPHMDTSVDHATITAIYERIRPHVRRTPVISVDAADFGLESRPLVFKLELLQHTGSFKPRGALASLLSLPVPPAGVVA